MRSACARSPATPSFQRWSMSAARWPGPAISGITAAATSRSAPRPRAKRWRKRSRPPASTPRYRDDIEVTLWSKLVINCAFNALSAVADISYGPMLEVEGAKDVVTRAVQEAIAVARACGVVAARRPPREYPEHPDHDAGSRSRPPRRISRAASPARSTFSTAMWCARARSSAFPRRPITPCR